jgi:signal transduction histidine kinase
MTSDAAGPAATDLDPAVQAGLSSVNAVFTLSLILMQATSPRQVMRLVTTAIPSIAPGHNANALHPSTSGTYYERAPDKMSEDLARLTGPGPLELPGPTSRWAFPLTSPRGLEPVFLIVAGSQPLSEEETFLLSVLAQLSGTVIAKLELNAELESTISTLTKIMETHHRLNEIVATAGESGIAETLHRLTNFPVRIQDVHGNIRAAAGDVPGDHGATDQREQRQELIRRLRIAYRAVYHRGAWLVLANPRADVLGVIALIDPARTASQTDLAALEYAATVLSLELARLQSVADAELRSRTARERDVARARAADLVAAFDTARQRITRDLHDGAQQRFVTTIINLQLAGEMWDSAPQRAKELLGLALRDARRGLDDLREIVAGIHPAVLTQRGLAAALRALTARLPVPVELDVTAQRLPEPVEASIYFFCSEALTNVVKHAHARTAWVRVDLADDRCTVEVRDDGIGGAAPPSRNSGLTGLRDRIGALGGVMEVSSPVDGGTTLQAWIPLSPGSAAGEPEYGA